MLLDSDEFVEFPYANIAETIRQLEFESANLMAAPMVQHITADGSLESPSTIDDPFQRFPLCSVDLYRRMGVKGDIFKFPLSTVQLTRASQREGITIRLVAGSHALPF